MTGNDVGEPSLTRKSHEKMCLRAFANVSMDAGVGEAIAKTCLVESIPMVVPGSQENSSTNLIRELIEYPTGSLLRISYIRSETCDRK